MLPRIYHFHGSSIAWYRFGKGARPVVCFHGYGENALTFSFLSKYLGEEYSFISIDLPYHGKTEWNGKDFSADDLVLITRGILEQQEPSWKDEKITLAGFSLGGRVALSLFQTIPGSIDRLVLLAPDGLKMNSWYWFATQTWAGNRLFNFTMKHPLWFLWMIRLLNKTGLINASIFKFVKYYINDQEVRRLLFHRWTSLRKLRPRISLIKSLVNRFKTPVHLIYGRHDRIILSSVGKRFCTGIESHCILREISAGHQVLHENHAQEIIPAFR